MATVITKTGEKVKVVRGDEIFLLPVNSTVWKSPYDSNIIIIDPEGKISSTHLGVKIDWTDVTNIVASNRDEMVDALNTNYFNNTDLSGAIGTTADAAASSSVAETTTASTGISLWKGIKNVLLLILAKFTDGGQKTQIVDPSGNVIFPNGVPVTVSQEITRPSNTTEYAAGDVINTDPANVAQVDTITLTGTAPAKQKETVTLTGTAPEKQVDTVTLTGTNGTAEITGAGGLTKTVTFATGGTTDLTQTAADFVTSFAADYLAEGIVLTSSAADLIFTAQSYGVAFTSPAIANLTGDLSGSVANTQANVLVGQAEITGAGGLIKTVVFDTAGGIDLTDTAAAFVTDYAADYLAAGITLTSSGADLIFESTTYGVAIVSPVIENVTGDLDGSVAVTQANVVVGEAEITVAGGLTKTVVFDTAGSVDLTDTAAAFVTDYAADYLAEGIVVTSSGADLIFTAEVAGVPFDSPVIDNTVGDLDGSVVNTAESVLLETLEFDGLSIANTGGGYLMDVKVHTDMAGLAGKTLRLYLYNAVPVTILGDNVAYVDAYADKNSQLFFVDIEMEAAAGSDSAIGQASVIKQFNTVAGNKLYGVLTTQSVVTPESEGKINVILSGLKLN